jgi:ubiquitin carboxyl-terminal hydrolase L3
MATWASAGIVPNVIAAAPTQELKVTYDQVQVQAGATLTPTQAQSAPTIAFSAEATAFYTVVMIDPDAPSREDPKFAQWLHWLAVNVPGSDLTQKGDVLAEYVGAAPPQDSGLHRYIVLVYKQEGKCDPKELQTFHRAAERPKFDVGKFVAKVGKHTQIGTLNLVAGNFFQAKWDECVPSIYKKLETMGQKVSKKRKNWLPLESNPDLMTKYVHALGVDKKYVFHEVMGVDEMMLGMVPQPVFAVLMLFPISKASEAHRASEEAALLDKPQTVNPGVYHVKQVIGNACGTIGLLHAVANNEQKLELDANKFFAKFLGQTQKMDLMERAVALEANTDIEVEHQSLAAEAKSDVSHAVNDNLHFNAFVEVGGDLYELDGRKNRPINHGKCTNLLYDACTIVQQFMSRDPNEIRFNLVALGLDQ